MRLGERESGTARLEQAINGLGNALTELGEREQRMARIEEAISAYSRALEVRTRERVPFDWAMTQANLGGALAALGGLYPPGTLLGTMKLERAVAAYRAALMKRRSGLCSASR